MKFYGVNKRNLTTFWTIFGKNPLWEFNANLCTCLNYLMMISKDTTLIGFTFLDQLRLFVTIWSIYRHNVFPRSLFAHLTFNFIFWNNKICIWMYYSKRIFIRQFFDFILWYGICDIIQNILAFTFIFRLNESFISKIFVLTV